MEFDLVEVFEKMSAFGLLIVGGLLLMGLASVTVVLERVWAFRRNRIRATHLVARIEPLANRGAWLEVCTEARSARHSPFASLVQGVTEAFALAHRSGNTCASPRRSTRRRPPRARTPRSSLPWAHGARSH